MTQQTVNTCLGCGKHLQQKDVEETLIRAAQQVIQQGEDISNTYIRIPILAYDALYAALQGAKKI